MTQAKSGDTVKIHYSGSLEDGTSFDSSRGKEPLQFTIGKGQVISGVENAVIGMNKGDTKTVSIAPDAAYGNYREEFVIVVKRAQIPPNIDPAVGMKLQIRSPEGGKTNVMVTDITDDNVKLDGNHPLAGKELTFEIELLEIT